MHAQLPFWGLITINIPTGRAATNAEVRALRCAPPAMEAEFFCCRCRDVDFPPVTVGALAGPAAAAAVARVPRETLPRVGARALTADMQMDAMASAV